MKGKGTISLSRLDIEIIEYIRKLLAITKQLPPISSLYILSLLGENDGVSQQDLATRLMMKPQSLSDHLRKMEQRGLITKENSEDDKRVMLVSLTELGRKEFSVADEKIAEYGDEFLRVFNENEKETLRDLLKRMIAGNKETEDVSPRATVAKSEWEREHEHLHDNPAKDPEHSFICSCKGRRCVVTWDDYGEVYGNYCSVGYDGAVETISRLKRQKKQKAVSMDNTNQ